MNQFPESRSVAEWFDDLAEEMPLLQRIDFEFLAAWLEATATVVVGLALMVTIK